jgi:hypothetical protein
MTTPAPGSYDLGQPAGSPAVPVSPPYYTQPYAPPPPKKKGMPGWAIVLIVLGGLVVLVCGGGLVLFGIGANQIASQPKPTVKVTDCSYDGVAFVTLSYALTNNDKRPHDYYLSGTTGHSPTLPDVLKGVAPGETVNGKLMGTSKGDCLITKVDQR